MKHGTEKETEEKTGKEIESEIWIGIGKMDSKNS